MEMRSYEEMMARHAERLERAGLYRSVQHTLTRQQRPGPVQKLLALWRRLFAAAPIPAPKKG